MHSREWYTAYSTGKQVCGHFHKPETVRTVLDSAKPEDLIILEALYLPVSRTVPTVPSLRS